jgi:V8-like Glu-specific endopeptidase
MEDAPESILNWDDRVFSKDPRVGRFILGGFEVGGTGWLMHGGLVLTAGHVADYGPSLIEFNVPLSKDNGATNSSKPEDTYKVTVLQSVPKNLREIGNDWAILKIFPNSNGDSAFKRQGDFFRISDQENIGNLVRVTGYGMDEHPKGTTGSYNSCNMTEQTDTGKIISTNFPSSNRHIIEYAADTVNGNSGSPVYLSGTHIAIGIHTNGGESSNKATGFKNIGLYNALRTHIHVTTYVDEDYFFTVSTGDGTLFQPYRRLEDGLDKIKSNGGILGIVSGYYGSPSGSSSKGPGINFPNAGAGKKYFVKALAGEVYFGRIVKK